MTVQQPHPFVALPDRPMLDETIAAWRALPGAIVALAFAPLDGAHARPRHAHASLDAEELWVAYAPTPQTPSPDIRVYVLAREHVDTLRNYLEAKDGPYCIFANAHRELTRLRQHGIVPRRYGCVRTAATLLAEGADGRRDDRSLDWCAAQTLGIELPALPSRESLATRVAVTIPVLRAYTTQLRTLALTRIFELECKLLPTVIDMEQTGVPVDAAAFERIAAGWAQERESTTDTARLARLDKLVSTYRYWGRDYTEYDGRMRCQLEPLATDSGRFACSSPNLQQVPSEHTAPGLRACFRPPVGRQFIVADYAQIELRVAAHVAGCAAMREVFRRGGDPHRATAATLTRKPEVEVTDRERKLAKAINFGFLFGMGAKRFSAYARDSFGIELDIEQAQRARAAFLATFPGIAAWHKRTAAMQGRNRHEDLTVCTVLGRRKRFPVGELSFSTALNIPVQGTAAEGFKQAMIDVLEPLRELGGVGVLCVHDEYVAEVPTENAERARTVVQTVLERSMAKIVDTVPIAVEARVAQHWS